MVPPEEREMANFLSGGSGEKPPPKDSDASFS